MTARQSAAIGSDLSTLWGLARPPAATAEAAAPPLVDAELSVLARAGPGFGLPQVYYNPGCAMALFPYFYLLDKRLVGAAISPILPAPFVWGLPE